MLAGAVQPRRRPLPPRRLLAPSRALSRSGRSRPFHREADGLVPAEGAAFVVLQRLDDARRAATDPRRHPRASASPTTAAAGAPRARPRRGRSARCAPRTRRRASLRGLPARVPRHRHAGRRRAEMRSTGARLRGARGRADRLAQVEPRPPDHRRRRGRPPQGARGDEGRHAAADASRRRAARRARGLAVPARRTARAVDVRRAEVAAVSAFGFGGNNAHLIVSEDDPELERTNGARDAATSAAAASAAGSSSLPSSPSSASAAPWRALRTVRDSPRRSSRTRASSTGGARAARSRSSSTSRGSAFRRGPRPDAPAAARHAPGRVRGARRERCAPARADRDLRRDGARPRGRPVGTRWRLARTAREAGASAEWLQGARDAVVPVLEAAAVVGTMPNIPANRLSSQLDLGGRAFTVQAEEASGTVALSLASGGPARRRARRGARRRRRSLLRERPPGALEALADADGEPPGDAAVVLVVKRLEDADGTATVSTR